MRFRGLSQEQSKASAHDVHRGTAASAAGELPAGFEPWRARPGAHRTGHGPEQAGHASLVPELQSTPEETPAHGERETESTWVSAQFRLG